MPLTLAQLRDITGGRLRLAAMPPRHGETTHVGPIVTDSRRVQAETVFWGLEGPRFRWFLLRRRRAGARSGRTWWLPAGISNRGRAGGRCASTMHLQALWKLAAWHRSQFTGRVVAVTGSVGKTTTRLMIDTVLRLEILRHSRARRITTITSVCR